MELSARFLAFTTYGVQWVLWLLIGLSVISVSVMLERLWHFATYRPSPKALALEIRLLLQRGSGPPAEPHSARASEVLDAAFEGTKARERLRLERNLAFLGTLGSNAPFIGLFGTVLGIIKAFHDLAGNQAGGPAVVMAGISEALVATAVGLMVAIPAVVGFNYFNRRVRTSMTEVDWMAHLALAELKTGDSQSAGEVAAAVVPMRWGRLVLPIGAASGLLLLGGGVLIGRSASTGAPAANRVTMVPAATTPLAAVAPAAISPPAIAPAVAGSAPIPSAALAPAPTSASTVAGAPVPTPALAGSPIPTPALAGAPVPTLALAGSPMPALAGSPNALPASTSAHAGPSARVPASTPPASQSSVAAPSGPLPGVAKPAVPPALIGNKAPKQLKGKKRRPPGVGQPASPANPPSAAGAKAEEVPPTGAAASKATEATPLAPAVP